MSETNIIEPAHHLIQTGQYMYVYKNLLEYAKTTYEPNYKVDMSLYDFIKDLNKDKFKQLCDKLSSRNPDIIYKCSVNESSYTMKITNKKTKDSFEVCFYTHRTYLDSKFAVGPDELYYNVFVDFSQMKCFFNATDEVPCDLNTYRFFKFHKLSYVLSVIDALTNILDFAKFYKVFTLNVNNIKLFGKKYLEPKASFVNFTFDISSFRVVVIKDNVIIKREYPYENWTKNLKEYTKLLNDER